MPNNVCPSTLTPGNGSFSRSAERNLFNGKRVSPILSFNSPFRQGGDVSWEEFTGGRLSISIAGVQPKISLLLDGLKLRPTLDGERGTFILKPIPNFRNGHLAPANEHLTMQIATQVYGIPVAGNSVVFFKNGEIAYLTERFDVGPDGRKVHMEDFASLSNRTEKTDGTDYKYKGSYEGMGEVIKRVAPAALPILESFFRLVVFNYLFSNGDAHLKNFSLLRSPQGDLVFSPAYDLLNTGFHINDEYFAMSEGLLKPGDYHNAGRSGRKDFLILASRLGLVSARVVRILDTFSSTQPNVEKLTSLSFLPENAKRTYLANYHLRRKSLLGKE
jgi:serine/threonine-protein kinase HipA